MHKILSIFGWKNENLSTKVTAYILIIVVISLLIIFELLSCEGGYIWLSKPLHKLIFFFPSQQAGMTQWQLN